MGDRLDCLDYGSLTFNIFRSITETSAVIIGAGESQRIPQTSLNRSSDR